MLMIISGLLIIVGLAIVLFIPTLDILNIIDLTDKQLYIIVFIGWIMFIIGFIIAGYNGWTIFNK
jgi:hypothetical protein